MSHLVLDDRTWFLAESFKVSDYPSLPPSLLPILPSPFLPLQYTHPPSLPPSLCVSIGQQTPSGGGRGGSGSQRPLPLPPHGLHTKQGTPSLPLSLPPSLPPSLPLLLPPHGLHTKQGTPFLPPSLPLSLRQFLPLSPLHSTSLPSLPPSLPRPQHLAVLPVLLNGRRLGAFLLLFKSPEPPKFSPRLVEEVHQIVSGTEKVRPPSLPPSLPRSLPLSLPPLQEPRAPQALPSSGGRIAPNRLRHRNSTSCPFLPPPLTHSPFFLPPSSLPPSLPPPPLRT